MNRKLLGRILVINAIFSFQYSFLPLCAVMHAAVFLSSYHKYGIQNAVNVGLYSEQNRPNFASNKNKIGGINYG